MASMVTFQSSQKWAADCAPLNKNPGEKAPPRGWTREQPARAVSGSLFAQLGNLAGIDLVALDQASVNSVFIVVWASLAIVESSCTRPRS